MFRDLTRLIVLAAFIFGGIYTWRHFHQAPHASFEETQAEGSEAQPIDAPRNKPFVTITGALANLVADQKPSSGDDTPRAHYKPSPKDHIEDSPVGTSSRILHKTFSVARVVHIPFEIPPHAVTPRFHGTFQSFGQQGGPPTNDESANVDLLLMNEQQYAEFSSGRDPDVLFIADTSHYQDVHFDLSPSRDQPVKYHLVFRNSPGGPAKKLVQADFTVDF
jgi:hypothetical protein